MLSFAQYVEDLMFQRVPTNCPYAEGSFSERNANGFYVSGSLLNAIRKVCSSACYLNGRIRPTKWWFCVCIKKSTVPSLELFGTKEYRVGFMECYVLQLCQNITNYK